MPNKITRCRNVPGSGHPILLTNCSSSGMFSLLKYEKVVKKYQVYSAMELFHILFSREESVTNVLQIDRLESVSKNVIEVFSEAL